MKYILYEYSMKNLLPGITLVFHFISTNLLVATKCVIHVNERFNIIAGTR